MIIGEYELGELTKKLDKILYCPLDNYAECPELRMRFLALTKEGAENPIAELAVSIMEEHLRTGEYPRLRKYAETAGRLMKSERGEDLKGPLFLASAVLAVKVKDYCISRGFVEPGWGEKP